MLGCGFTTAYPWYGYYPGYLPALYSYSAYAWPALYQPVVFSPIVTPVYTPVVVDPAYSYWYPASYYYFSYPGLTAPAYVAPGSSAGGSDMLGVDAAMVSPAAGVKAPPTEPAEASVTSQSQDDTLEEGLSALRNGQAGAARQRLSEAVSAEPNSGIAQMLYTAALVADGRYSTAAIALRDALQVWGDGSLDDFYLPTVYGDEEYCSQYTRDLRAFLSDHPDRSDGWLLTIWASAFSGESAEAAQLLAEARKTWPDDPALAAMGNLIRRDS